MRIRSGVRRLLASDLFYPMAVLAKRRAPFPVTTVRRESLNSGELIEQARHLAQTHRVRSVYDRGLDVLSHLSESARRVRDGYFTFSAAAREKRPLPPGIDWLLDNYHVVQQVRRDLKIDLSAAFYHRLPKLKRGPYRRYPRVLSIAAEYTGLTDSRFDRERFSSFISGYQSD